MKFFTPLSLTLPLLLAFLVPPNLQALVALKNPIKPVQLSLGDQFSIDLESQINFEEVEGPVSIRTTVGKSFAIDDLYEVIRLVGNYKMVNQVQHLTEGVSVAILDHSKVLVFSTSTDGLYIEPSRFEINVSDMSTSILYCTDILPNLARSLIYVGCFRKPHEHSKGSIHIYSIDLLKKNISFKVVIPQSEQF